MESIKAYVDHLQEIDVILSVDKTRSSGVLHTSEVTVWAKGINFRASQSHNDMYASIDLILDKLQKQITKYKEKIKAKKPRRKDRNAEFQFKNQILHYEEPFVQETPAETEEPKVIRSNNFYSKPMDVVEAAEQLKYLHQEFIVFSNAQTGEVNVVYRRNDGHVGLIEPHAR